jgi:hypothetical protein
MAAFNVVRFRVKPGYEQRFIDVYREQRPVFDGFLGGNLIDTGDRWFCIVGEWRDTESLVAARPEMIRVLDLLREMLEDLGMGLGVTDPVSGTSVLTLPGARAKKKAKKKSKKPAARKKAKKKKNTKKKKKKKAKKK